MELTALLDDLHMEDLRNPTHPTIFDVNDGYDMLIMRIPRIENGAVVHQGMGFIITADTAYWYDRSRQTFEPLGDRFETMHEKIDREADALLHSFEGFKETIEEMEDRLYSNRSAPNFMRTWLRLKRDILRIERTLSHATQVLSEMIAHYESFEAFPINYYVDIHEHLERTARSAVLQLGKLDYIYNFFNTQNDEKLNRMIYILTIISAIFLPLNLLVGFFGMNTTHLPFSDIPHGTQSVMIGMIVVAVVAVLGILFIKKREEEL